MIGNLIYRGLIRYANSTTVPGKLCFRLFAVLRALVLKVADPCVEMEVRGKRMFLPLSLHLPLLVAREPQYNGPFERLARYLKANHGRIVGIDVGANIGDTVLICRHDDSDAFLGIEADGPTAAYFRKNCGRLETVKLVECLCSSTDDAPPANGVASPSPARRTLDAIVGEHDEFRHFNFLKVDVEGHDFDVLKGARQGIARNTPAIFFEVAPFGNGRYAEDFLETIRSLRDSGYKSILMYDNIGYMFGRYALDDEAGLAAALYYQVTSRFYYFDALVMREDDFEPFFASELRLFIDQTPDPGERRAAEVLAGLVGPPSGSELLTSS